MLDPLNRMASQVEAVVGVALRAALGARLVAKLGADEKVTLGALLGM